MSKLNTSIHALAQQFATEILEAVRKTSLGEVLGETNASGIAPRRGRPPGGSNAGTPKRGRPPKLTVDAVVGVLKKHKDGLRSDRLRKALGGVKRGAWRYAIQKAIAEKK